jgi:hypothetical protein
MEPLFTWAHVTHPAAALRVMHAAQRLRLLVLGKHWVDPMRVKTLRSGKEHSGLPSDAASERVTM